MNQKFKILLFILLPLLLFTAWIMIDLNYPYKTDIAKFNHSEVARLESEMWKSYYEKKKLGLFLLSAELMRKQFHVSFWRSQAMAYYAARAAFVFKDGRNTDDYNKALPYLIKYYSRINDISRDPFDVNKAAELELKWWVIRRYRNEHPPSEWEKCLMQNAETVYHVPAENFSDYAHQRVNAMLLRDSKENAITKEDWEQIRMTLDEAWKSFSEQVHR